MNREYLDCYLEDDQHQYEVAGKVGALLLLYALAEQRVGGPNFPKDRIVVSTLSCHRHANDYLLQEIYESRLTTLRSRPIHILRPDAWRETYEKFSFGRPDFQIAMEYLWPDNTIVEETLHEHNFSRHRPAIDDSLALYLPKYLETCTNNTDSLVSYTLAKSYDIAYWTEQYDPNHNKPVETFDLLERVAEMSSSH